MRIRSKLRKGHDYYSVVTSVRINGKVKEKTILYLGRLDNLTEQKRLELVKKLKELGDPKLISKFHSILHSVGYEFPSHISMSELTEEQRRKIEAILQETSIETRSEAEPISESVNISEVKDQGFDSKFPQAYRALHPHLFQ